MSVLANELAARLAIEHVRRVLIYGAGNRADNALQPVAFRRQLEARMDVAVSYELTGEIPTTRSVAQTAIASGAGNCGQQAVIALRFIERMGALPIDMMFCPLTDHNFLVIGRDANSDPEDDSTWGGEAVVCDPWSDLYGVPSTPAVQTMLVEFSDYRLQFRVERSKKHPKYFEAPF